MNIQPLYQQTIRFAAAKHGSQKIPGSDLPYVVHLSNVAMEVILAGQQTPDFDTAFAMQLALLHDVLEDTATTPEEVEFQFGKAICHGVKALTKNKELPKEEQMADSLNRIRLQPKEVWAVKLADRITNLQPPPVSWNRDKCIAYLAEAKAIHQYLGEGNRYLSERLKEHIANYDTYFPLD